MAQAKELTIAPIGFGLGTAWYAGWKHNNDESPLSDNLVEQLQQALTLGFRHVDLAEMYGNDREAAKALSLFFKSSGVPRSDLWITHKVFVNMNDPIQGCKDAIARLGCEYLDLWLLHSPLDMRRVKKEYPVVDLELPAIWQKMEELVALGLVKKIGVSNFRKSDLELLLANCKIRPFCNQVEFNAYLQQPKLQEFCKKNQIMMQAYSPLAPLEVKNGPIDELRTKIEKQHGVTPAAVLIRYAQQKGFNVVTTTSKPERVLEYLALSNKPSFDLTPEEMAQMDELGSKHYLRKYWLDFFTANSDAGLM